MLIPAQQPIIGEPGPAPLPSINATRKAIIDLVVNDAIDAYEDAHRRYTAYDGATDCDGILDKVLGLAFEHLEAARNNLVRALLARDLDLDFGEARHIERTVQRTCGVVRGGRMYQANVIAGYADAPIGDEPSHRDDPIMKLVVSDVAAVPKLGEPSHPADDPAEAVEDLDDEPDDSVQVIDTRPGQPVPEGRRERRKMPLLRATHTLCAPWDNWPVSVELLVLAGEGDGDHTASAADLPELNQAGWRDYEIGPLKFYVRLVMA